MHPTPGESPTRAWSLTAAPPRKLQGHMRNHKFSKQLFLAECRSPEWLQLCSLMSQNLGLEPLEFPDFANEGMDLPLLPYMTAFEVHLLCIVLRIGLKDPRSKMGETEVSSWDRHITLCQQQRVPGTTKWASSICHVQTLPIGFQNPARNALNGVWTTMSWRAFSHRGIHR